MTRLARTEASVGTLIKHSAAIQIRNQTTTLQRKIANICLWNAYPNLMTQEIHQITITLLKKLLGIRSNNNEHLKEAFRLLNRTQVEFNLFGKDKSHEWGVTTVLAQAVITDGTLLEYAYSPKMRHLLWQPSIYAKLNLEVQKGFRSKHAIALWEYLVDALGGRRDETIIRIGFHNLRGLLAIGTAEYPGFNDFKRRVLNPAIAEINRGADINATVKPLRRRRSVYALEFAVVRHTPLATDVTLLSPTRQEATLLQRLEALGLNQQKAQQILSCYEHSYITEILTIVDKALSSGHVKNPTGYVIKALADDYRPKYAKGVPKSRSGQVTEQKNATERERDELMRAFQRHRIKRAREVVEALPKANRARLEDDFIRTTQLITSNPLNALLAEGGLENERVMRGFLIYAGNFVLDRREDQELSEFARYRARLVSDAQDSSEAC